MAYKVYQNILWYLGHRDSINIFYAHDYEIDSRNIFINKSIILNDII